MAGIQASLGVLLIDLIGQSVGHISGHPRGVEVQALIERNKENWSRKSEWMRVIHD